MAAAIKGINARIRSNKVLDYFFSTRMFFASLRELLNIAEMTADATLPIRFLGPSIQFWYTSGRHLRCAERS